MLSKLREYELKELVQAPLLATIDAEISLNDRIQEFIRMVGFEKVSEEITSDEDRREEAFYELRMIGISYELNGESKILEVPALSLVALPLLTVKEASFDMKINLVATPLLKSDEREPILLAQPTAGRQNSLFPKKHESGNLKVNLKLQEGDMPSGLQELYGKMNQLINVKEHKK